MYIEELCYTSDLIVFSTEYLSEEEAKSAIRQIIEDYDYLVRRIHKGLKVNGKQTWEVSYV